MKKVEKIGKTIIIEMKFTLWIPYKSKFAGFFFVQTLDGLEKRGDFLFERATVIVDFGLCHLKNSRIFDRIKFVPFKCIQFNSKSSKIIDLNGKN